MKSELSLLLDGELEADRQSAVWSALGDDADLRAAWGEYHLIGDALRQMPSLDVDLTSRVMARLQHEPVVLAPRVRGLSKTWPQAGLRYAAALMGVGFVAWLALSSPATTLNPLQTPPVLAAATSPSSAQKGSGAAGSAGSAGSASRLQAYLVAHHAYSPSNRFDGGAGYIRTVTKLQ